MIEAVRQLHPPKVWEDLSINLYTTFWVLSTYDVYVPAGRYEEEIGKAKQAIKDLETSSDLVSEVVSVVSVETKVGVHECLLGNRSKSDS